MYEKKSRVKKYALLVISLMMALSICQASENRIVGIWLDDKGESKTRIFKTTSGDYAGKVIWLKDSLDRKGNLKLDKNNPVKLLRTKKLVGEAIVFKGITYNNAEQYWNCPYAYSPKLGMVGKGKMWFDEQRLYIKAKKFGFSKTRSFTRVK